MEAGWRKCWNPLSYRRPSSDRPYFSRCEKTSADVDAGLGACLLLHEACVVSDQFCSRGWGDLNTGVREQKASGPFDRKCLCKEVPLTVVTFQKSQSLQLILGLNSFRNDFEVEALSQL